MVKRNEKEAVKPEVTTAQLAKRLHSAGIELFKERSGFPLNQAQRNLDGRTDYASDAKLKNNVGKIHAVHVLDDGLILGLVESIQAGASEDSGRLYRPVFFDVFGNVIYRPKNDESFSSIKQAQSDFWRQSDEIDAVDSTMEGLDQKEADIEKQLQEIKKLRKDIEE